MKKFLFFAMALVASVLAFTSCDNGNNPSSPTDVTPAALAGTNWRVDSSHVDGKLDFMPHAYIEVKTDKQVVFNGSDTTNYWIEGDQLSYGETKADGNAYTIKQFSKTFAHLAVSMDGEVWELFLSIVPDPEGAQLDKTAENIVGTWKSQHYSYRYSQYDATTETYIWGGNKHSDPGVVYWTFYADGTFTSTNIVFAKMPEQSEYASQTGYWAVKDGKFAWSWQNDLDQMAEDNWEDIVTLTSNAFYFGKTTQSWTGTTQERYTYYTRVK